MSSTPESLASEAPLAENTPPAAGLIARQAIVDEKREVFGYELFDRSTVPSEHTATTDAAVLFNTLSGADAEVLVGKKTVFVNCTHESLSGGHLELIHPEKVVLEIPTLPDDPPAEIEARAVVLKDLHAKGFRLAFNQSVLKKPYASWIPLAAFIKLEMTAFPQAMAESLVRFVSTQTKAKIIAEKVETVGPTGVEMEALTAVQVGLLTIYDMCKAADRGMVMTDVRVLEKHGGASGSYIGA